MIQDIPLTTTNYHNNWNGNCIWVIIMRKQLLPRIIIIKNATRQWTSFTMVILQKLTVQTQWKFVPRVCGAWNFTNGNLDVCFTQDNLEMSYKWDTKWTIRVDSRHLRVSIGVSLHELLFGKSGNLSVDLEGSLLIPAGYRYQQANIECQL